MRQNLRMRARQDYGKPGRKGRGVEGRVVREIWEGPLPGEF